MDKVQRALVAISYLIRIIFVLTIVISFYENFYTTAFLAILALILSFLPSIFSKNYKVSFPIEFELFILIFIFASIFLGEIHAYYTKYYWWDIVLHTFSGLILGMIGFLLVYMLNYSTKIHLHLSPNFIALFSFSFAVTIGVIWEIFEFAMDQIFGFNMQKSGIVDTMWDLIVNTIGALIISIMAYFYTKKVKVPFFDEMMEKFTKQNPSFFKRFKLKKIK